MTSPELQIQENVRLAPLTTLGVGGSARYFCAVTSVEEVKQAVIFARDRQLKLFVLGGGSNVVVADEGFNGLVLHVAILGIEDSPLAVLNVGGGVNWDEFVTFCVGRGYGGVECLSGIPGSVGGTPVQNVGAYGQEVSETIRSVLAFDLREGRVRELKDNECGFAYRSSIFNTGERGRYIILRVTYEMKAGAEPALRYADLQKYFAGHEGKPSLSDVREAVLKIRASKGMVIDPNDPDSRSAGSFFKNPVLSADQYKRLSEKAAERRLKVPSYPALAQQSKVSAAWLVENSGFHKGYVKGRVGISNKHSLAIVNCGGATAAEVLLLRDEIQRRVDEIWGVRLQPEPVVVG
jgi:UDP-N-acetylmuramate dehydrogenase